MRRALGEYLISGIQTTIPFHTAIMHHADFRNGHYDTGFVDRLMSSETFELRPSNNGRLHD
jgi:acetyl-CoA carboxylase, biotin carboxylase subunit